MWTCFVFFVSTSRKFPAVFNLAEVLYMKRPINVNKFNKLHADSAGKKKCKWSFLLHLGDLNLNPELKLKLLCRDMIPWGVKAKLSLNYLAEQKWKQPRFRPSVRGFLCGWCFPAFLGTFMLLYLVLFSSLFLQIVCFLFNQHKSWTLVQTSKNISRRPNTVKQRCGSLRLFCC